MEFVWIKHPNIEQPVKQPASSLPHWEGYGWVRCDPPAKPPRPPRRTGKPARVRAPRPTSPPAPPVNTTPVVRKSAATAKTTSPKTAPRGEED